MAVDAQALFDHLWSTKYLPRYIEQRTLAEQRRAEAFAGGARVIGSWLLRVMTPYDALLFEGADSPFICGNPADSKPDDLAWALWQLRADNSPKWFPEFARDRQILRWRKAWLRRDPATGEWYPTEAYRTQLTAFLSYLETIFADSALPRRFDPEAAAKPADAPAPLGTHWLAPLLVSLCCEMGPRDPVGDQPWAHAPLPQIWQYRRELRARETGKAPLEDGAPAEVRSTCLDEVNAILAGTIPNPIPTNEPVQNILPTKVENRSPDQADDLRANPDQTVEALPE